MAVWIGVYPHTFLNMIDAPAQNIIAQVQPYLAEHGGGLLELAGCLVRGVLDAGL